MMLFFVPSHLYAECVNLVQMKCILSPFVCSRQSVNLVDKAYRKRVGDMVLWVILE